MNIGPISLRQTRSSKALTLQSQALRDPTKIMSKLLLNFRTIVALTVFFMSASNSFADQFVLFDVTFPFTKADADNAKPSQSHYYVKGKVSARYVTSF